ncbi:unnamed protein product [Ixodes persulcatus]
MPRAPHLVQRLLVAPIFTLRGGKIAHEAHVAEELLEMRFAVSMSFLLVVPASVERLLALGAHEVLGFVLPRRPRRPHLDVPLLSQCAHDARVFDRPPAGGAHGGRHLVATLDAVQFTGYFAALWGHKGILPALGAVEVIGMVDVASVSQRSASATRDHRSNLLALGAGQLAGVLRLYGLVALAAVREFIASPPVYADEPGVRETRLAAPAAEAVGVPVPAQGPDQSARDVSHALGAHRDKQPTEVVLAVVAPFELPLTKWSYGDAHVHETLGVPDLTAGVDNLLELPETFPTLGARH